MLLAIDIGNTNTSFALFNGKKIKTKFDIPTEKYSRAILLRKLRGETFTDSIICSVVPRATKTLSSDLKKLMGKTALICGENLKVPVKNLYRKPSQVGADRLVNAFAGYTLYKAPLIAIDFGTAITFDCISKNKEYLGGIILPGLGICLQSLKDNTALLPKVKLKAPQELIGRDTKNSILSGIIFGYASMTDALIDKIKLKIGKSAFVIATGGNSGLIARFCRKINRLDTTLTLKGLNLIYDYSMQHND